MPQQQKKKQQKKIEAKRGEPGYKQYHRSGGAGASTNEKLYWFMKRDVILLITNEKLDWRQLFFNDFSVDRSGLRLN